MKRTIIILFVMLAMALTGAHAGPRLPVLAQAETPAPATAPEATPAPAKRTATETPAPLVEPAPVQEMKPAMAEPARAEGSAEALPASEKQDHSGFAAMEVKECKDCHAGQSVAPNHDADWVRGHRLLAAAPQKNCTACHMQSFCLDCHKGGGIDVNLNTEISRAGTAPESHRTDFREIHPIKALDNPQTCTRCHSTRSCTECHEKFRGEDLRILSHRKGWSNLQTASPGPIHETFNVNQCQTCHPGGVLPKHVWSSDHAREARRNLQACQTCHSDGDVCMTCHSARVGLKVNPHPRGWGGVAQGYKKRSDGRSCIKCHDNY